MLNSLGVTRDVSAGLDDVVDTYNKGARGHAVNRTVGMRKENALGRHGA